MANIEIITFTKIKEIIGKKKFFYEASSVENLLYKMFEEFGEILKTELLDIHGEVKEHYRIIVNGRNINLLEGFKTILNEGDMIAFMPAIAGGN
ncbi:MAG: MoaD/ThiS family protein [Candidatus Heimdallarchaeota archaeon]|nr:MoaD/ThiS family protein [Candidatus Heimdallarchaeota archaeon]MCG3255535.1 MoaD/ThiS family protein [Candidatus Heimdallarchaeota archaeon]MCK4610610.1 MoaD/ThiS family protein [Candidatus Heimdallarchaeota archaeon]